MRHQKHHHFLSRTVVAGLLVTGVAASLVPVKAASNEAKPKPNYVIGSVTDTAGKPLSDVKVAIYGTTMAGSNTRFEMEPDVQGKYSQRVPEGIYGVTAYVKKSFNSNNYSFTLPPTDGITAIKHDSADGIVKNFVWRIHGLKPGATPGEEGAHTETSKYFGGYVYITVLDKNSNGEALNFPAGSTLEITLTPRGPLIDGSEGQPKTFRRTFEGKTTSFPGWHLTDIPVGPYTLIAKLLLPGGGEKSLGVKNVTFGFSEPVAPSAAVNFEPTGYGDLQMMQVWVEP